MQINNLDENVCLTPGNFYADIAEDEGPTAIILRINADGSEDRIDEYDIPWESVKLENANNGRIPSDEEEYNAFIKWLETHTDIDTIYVTYDLIRQFYFPFEEECYIDPEDGFAKFPDSEE